MNHTDVTKEEDDDLKYVILTDFAHLDEVNQLIDTLTEILGVQYKEEAWEDRLQYIFNQYQAQPHLLDPYLEILLHKCIKLIGKAEKIERKESFVFRLIYLMVKTRGYKTIIRLMPHEVSDLEPVLSMLADVTVNDNENWQARYVLLLWLSIVIMIPFDMNLFDSETKEPIADRILKAGKYFLLSKDVSQIAAAFMLSKFLSRPDTIRNGLLNETIHWAIHEIKNIKMDHIDGHNFMCGLLRLFTYLFKFGKREDLLPFSTLVLETNNQINCVKWEREILLCRLRTKLVQRIGLVFLKVKVITWRYQRGNRLLLQNLDSANIALSNNEGDLSHVNQFEPDADCFDDVEVSEHLDEVIDFLINSLKNYFTFVRWSAAKGIGRICSRLSKALADDVVEAILVLFSRFEGFSSWHGGCLALAELGRRGYLLPQRLPEVLPLIIKALYYDEKSGECSYGANVRDAACYVCWSFARAYNPDELRPYVVDIASTLIMVTLFDRQVNVRRAAAAAFQENVGRQGQFPHGIDILTTCDYFAVRNSTNCFLNLSVFIASFEEYVKPMIDHLVELKIGHWDYNIRELTAKALNRLMPFAPEYLIKQVLPNLIKSCTGLDLYKRQGSIMGVGELVRCMDSPNDLPSDMRSEIQSICIVLDQRMQFRGLSGELMRKAMCHLIMCCSTANMRFHDEPIIDIWYKFLSECATHKEKIVRAAAIDAFPAFIECYCRDTSQNLKVTFTDNYIDDCCYQIQKSSTEYIQATFLIILGKTPAYLLDTPWKSDPNISKITFVLDLLLEASKIEPSRTAKWGEARSCALTSLIDICQTVGILNEHLTKKLLLEIYSILLISLDDYTLDSHGDIGALVRESAMRSLFRLSELLSVCETRKLEIFDDDLSQEIISKIAQQAVEKIDRVRNTAGTLFYKLIYMEPAMPCIANHEAIKAIFPLTVCEKIYWASPQLSFPLFGKLLQFDAYRYRVVLGMVVSVGGMTEKTVQFSREALHSCLKDHESDDDYLSKLSDCIIRVMDSFANQDRVIHPIFKLIDFIHSDPIYSEFIAQKVDTLTLIIDKTKREICASKDILKIKSGIEVFCTMLQFDEVVWRKALNALMVLIGHKFPVIRKHTATYMYQSLLMYDIIEEEKLEDVMNILQDTIWDNDLSEVRQVRNKLCNLFDIPIPKPITVKS